MMQFQLRLFSTLVAVIAATQSLPKEHVALVQRHAATFTATETEPESDSDANLVATNTSAACPFGYENSGRDLKGSSAVKSSTTTKMSECASECAKRAECTAFEVGWTSSFKGCWTYIGGAADIQKGIWSGQGFGWTTCVKTCPTGFVQSTRDLNGDTAVKDGATDLEGCAAACEARTGGCTAFEYGTVGIFKGCWTYLDGQADIQSNVQFPGWTTCAVSFGRWTSERKHSVFQNGGRKVDVFCGKSTDVFKIESRPSNWCKTNKGCDGWVIVNQAGAERSNAWYCDCQGGTELVGVPTFEPDDTCANEHQVADDSN